jgi:hypothetical protein
MYLEYINLSESIWRGEQEKSKFKNEIYINFSKSSLFKPACLIISSRVPGSISLWFGTTTALFEPSLLLTRTI